MSRHFLLRHRQSALGYPRRNCDLSVRMEA